MKRSEATYPLRFFLWVTGALFGLAALAAPAGAASATTPTTSPPTTVESAPADTVNEFVPEDRSIGECISAVPKPGCGSEARGGWHQYIVAIVLVSGLVFVGWRIVVGVRKASQRPAPG